MEKIPQPVPLCPACGTEHEIVHACPPALTLDVLDELQLGNLPDPVLAIDGRTQEGACELLYGPSGKGKSSLAIDRACCRTTGRVWLGAKVLKPGAVLYCVTEAVHVHKKRVFAWKREHQIQADRIGLGFYTLPAPLNLMDLAEVAALVRTVERLGGIAEIVFDTFAGSIVGADENSAKDMGLIVSRLDWIGRRTDAGRTLVHHTGRRDQRHERGSTVMAAYADCVLALDVEKGSRGDNGHRILRCVKQRAFPEFAPLHLKLTPTADGTAAFFEPCQGAAASFGSSKALRAEILDDLRAKPPVSGSAMARRMKRNKQAVLDELKEMAKDNLIVFDQGAAGWVVLHP